MIYVLESDLNILWEDFGEGVLMENIIADQFFFFNEFHFVVFDFFKLVQFFVIWIFLKLIYVLIMFFCRKFQFPS